MNKPISLIGLPASGKSTLGKQLARKLDQEFIDLDGVLESRFGCSISKFFADRGEGVFRQEEHQALQDILTDQGSGYVLATGGGTPCFYDNIGLLKKYTTTVYLQIEWVDLASRLAGEQSGRPLLRGLPTDKIEGFLEEKFGWRIPFYQQAEYRVDSHDSLDELLELWQKKGLLK